MNAKKRNAYLRKTYGLTNKQFKLMVNGQADRCAICYQLPKRGTRLHVDHDHENGRVRGGLCWFCNHKFLGRRRENPEHHERAAAYLRSIFDWRNA